MAELKRINSFIKDITINYAVDGKINLLAATPENTGILSITPEFKLFTYFNDKYTHYLLKSNNITKYEQSGELFDYNFKNNSTLERYFVEFIYDKKYEFGIEEDINIEKEKNTDEKKLEKSSKKEYFDNSLKYLQRKRK